MASNVFRNQCRAHAGMISEQAPLQPSRLLFERKFHRYFLSFQDGTEQSGESKMKVVEILKRGFVPKFKWTAHLFFSIFHHGKDLGVRESSRRAHIFQKNERQTSTCRYRGLGSTVSLRRQ